MEQSLKKDIKKSLENWLLPFSKTVHLNLFTLPLKGFTTLPFINSQARHLYPSILNIV